MPKFQRCLFHEVGRKEDSHPWAGWFHALSSVLSRKMDRRWTPPFALCFREGMFVRGPQAPALVDTVLAPSPWVGVNSLSRFADQLVRNGWDGEGYGLALAMPTFQTHRSSRPVTLRMIHLGWGPWGGWFDRRQRRDIAPEIFGGPTDHRFRCLWLGSVL